MTSKIEIRVPDIGDFSDVEVIELLVAVGDTVELEDGLVSLETDKATMDVPASAAGQIVSLEIAVGDTVNQGDVIAVVESAESSEEPVKVEPADTSDDPAYAATAVLPETAKVALKESAGPAEEIDIRVPDIGDFSDVEVIEILVSPGDTVELDDGLVSLETDKATMDVPSSHAGTLSAVLVEVGDKVNKGDVIARLKVNAELPNSVDELMQPEESRAPAAAAPAKKEPPAAKPSAAKSNDASPVLPAVDEAGFASAHASPSVRKLARELGVNLKEVKGSGRKGRIVHDDVKAWVKSLLSGGALLNPCWFGLNNIHSYVL
ncbi:MAG: biotin/lipoyl-containing protein [Pseudomonadota bacterium]